MPVRARTGLSSMRARHRLLLPQDTDRVLLHSCCAPCSSAIIEWLLDNGIHTTVFYFNPNIHPRLEYERRKAESLRHARSLGVPFVDADYDPKAWFAQTADLADAPERGPRCALCFRLRLSETARYASAHGFGVFTTTLAGSRWKDRTQILDAGRAAASDWPGLVYWEQDWRKGGLTERKAELTREYDFYRQTYCGCVYSLGTSRSRRIPDGRPEDGSA